MSDTILCYNENEKCDECGRSPVTVLFLVENKIKSLCPECFNKITKAEQKD